MTIAVERAKKNKTDGKRRKLCETAQEDVWGSKPEQTQEEQNKRRAEACQRTSQLRHEFSQKDNPVIANPNPTHAHRSHCARPHGASGEPLLLRR